MKEDFIKELIDDLQEKISWTKELKAKPEFTDFRFQKIGTEEWKYVGQRVTITNNFSAGTWVLESKITIQYLSEDTSIDLGDITVGAGEPKKTIYMTNYGKKSSNIRWEEKSKEDIESIGYTVLDYYAESTMYLVKIQDESHDTTSFAQDAAEFMLSQVNILTTQATVTLLLDAYNYYNIGLDNRINLNNTLESNIYNNNNGFPLNIDSITISCTNRIVTLNLTNFGQNWKEKTSNFLNNYTPENIISVEKKYQPITVTL